MNKTFVMTAMALAIVGCDDTDTLPDKNGNHFGQIALEGSPVVGETMSVTVTDGNGVDASAITYSWMADGLAIEGATSSSYVITSAEAGAAISVTAAYTDDDNFSEVLTSNETSSVLMNIKGVVTISGILASGKLLTANVTDENDIGADGIVFAWFADDVVIEGANEATLALTDELIGKVITVTATYTDGENFSEAIVSAATAAVDVAGENVPATFLNLAVTTSKDVSDQITGTIGVDDGDVGESSIMAQTNTSTMYGTFSIDTSGNWTYSLNTAAAAVLALVDASDTINDTISIQSADGTMANFVITIAGLDAVEARKVARITDSSDSNSSDNSGKGDAGELRYKLAEDLKKGKLTVSFMKEDNAYGIDPNPEKSGDKDAYITLFGTSGSVNNSIVDLRIQSGQFAIRNIDDEITIPFEPGVWTDVEMTWDATNATNDVAPLVTVTINGESVLSGEFSSPSRSLGNVIDGVDFVAFKFGDDGSSIADAAYYIDDIKIYSDLAGTELVFADDFEKKDVGYNLDPDINNDPLLEYHPNTFEAVVYEIEAVDPNVPVNKKATFDGLTATTANDNSSDLTGTITVTDADEGQSLATVQTDTVTSYGTFSIAANGDWVYKLDTANSAVAALVSVSDTLTDEITITSVDATEATFTVTITGKGAAVNTPATFSGLAITTTNDITAELTGKVTITDADAGESFATVQTDTVTTYGTFSITADGDWTYELDTADSTISSLSGSSDSVMDEVTIESTDGTTEKLVITITGTSNEAPNNVAKIVDSTDTTSGVKDGKGETGELYYDFPTDMNEGQVSVSILYSDTETESAYISLYTEGGSTCCLVGELKLDEGKFSLRDNDGGNDPIGAPNFTPGTWIDVKLTWNTTSTTEPGTYSVIIDDVVYGPFKSENLTPNIPVVSTTVRLASDGKLSTDAIYVDNYNVYSDEAGTMPVMEEDFEDFDVDTSLVGQDPFGSRTYDATVINIGGTEEPNLRIARIVDSTDTTSGVKDGKGETGELYYDFPTDMNEGQVSVSILYSDTETESAYISLYTEGGSTCCLVGELKLDEGKFSLRDNDGGNDPIGAPNFTPGTWIDVKLTWNTTSTTEPGTYSVIIDDVVYGPFKSENLTPNIPVVSTTVRLASDGKLSTDAIYVDNYNVYSDEAGTMPVMEEDFEDFDVDTSLVGQDPFGSRTYDATVVAKE